MNYMHSQDNRSGLHNIWPTGHMQSAISFCSLWERSQLQKMLQKPNLRWLTVLSEFLPHYNKIDFCKLRWNYI